jgi:hypothetical protein
MRIRNGRFQQHFRLFSSSHARAQSLYSKNVTPVAISMITFGGMYFWLRHQPTSSSSSATIPLPASHDGDKPLVGSPDLPISEIDSLLRVWESTVFFKGGQDVVRVEVCCHPKTQLFLF